MLADILRVAMWQQGLAVRQVAERSGVPWHTVNNLLTGRRKNPHLDVIGLIAQVLDLDMNMVVFEQYRNSPDEPRGKRDEPRGKRDEPRGTAYDRPVDHGLLVS